jgi:hypothetical protein
LPIGFFNKIGQNQPIKYLEPNVRYGLASGHPSLAGDWWAQAHSNQLE